MVLVKYGCAVRELIAVPSSALAMLDCRHEQSLHQSTNLCELPCVEVSWQSLPRILAPISQKLRTLYKLGRKIVMGVCVEAILEGVVTTYDESISFFSTIRIWRNRFAVAVHGWGISGLQVYIGC
jgi:hypothetical protein